MKLRKIIATLLTLCMISVILPPAPTGADGDSGISTHEYSSLPHVN